MTRAIVRKTKKQFTVFKKYGMSDIFFYVITGIVAGALVYWWTKKRE